jgi:hypothetical protein
MTSVLDSRAEYGQYLTWLLRLNGTLSGPSGNVSFLIGSCTNAIITHIHFTGDVLISRLAYRDLFLTSTPSFFRVNTNSRLTSSDFFFLCKHCNIPYKTS